MGLMVRTERCVNNKMSTLCTILFVLTGCVVGEATEEGHPKEEPSAFQIGGSLEQAHHSRSSLAVISEGLEEHLSSAGIEIPIRATLRASIQAEGRVNAFSGRAVDRYNPILWGFQTEYSEPLPYSVTLVDYEAVVSGRNDRSGKIVRGCLNFRERGRQVVTTRCGFHDLQSQESKPIEYDGWWFFISWWNPRDVSYCGFHVVQTSPPVHFEN